MNSLGEISPTFDTVYRKADNDCDDGELHPPVEIAECSGRRPNGSEEPRPDGLALAGRRLKLARVDNDRLRRGLRLHDGQPASDLHLIKNALDLLRAHQHLVEAIAGIIGLPAPQITRCALDGREDRETGPFLRQALAELGAIDLPGNEKVVAAAQEISKLT